MSEIAGPLEVQTWIWWTDLLPGGSWGVDRAIGRVTVETEFNILPTLCVEFLLYSLSKSISAMWHHQRGCAGNHSVVIVKEMLLQIQTHYLTAEDHWYFNDSHPSLWCQCAAHSLLTQCTTQTTCREWNGIKDLRNYLIQAFWQAWDLFQTLISDQFIPK